MARPKRPNKNQAKPIKRPGLPGYSGPQNVTRRTLGINQGDMVIFRNGHLYAFNPATQGFTKDLGRPEPTSSFYMTLGSCIGVLARQLDPNREVKFSMVHVWHPARMNWRKKLSRAYHGSRFFRTKTKMQGMAMGLKNAEAEKGAEILAGKIHFPGAFADDAVKRLIETMGPNIEVRMIGKRISTKAGLYASLRVAGVKPEAIKMDKSIGPAFVTVRPFGSGQNVEAANLENMVEYHTKKKFFGEMKRTPSRFQQDIFH